jgi:hypothetical protein
MQKAEQIEQFTRIRLGLSTVVSGITDEQSMAVITGEWNLRQVVAHINGWDYLTKLYLADLVLGKVPAWGGEEADINIRSIAERSNMTWPTLKREHRLLGQLVIAAYNTVPTRLWHKPIWPDHDITPEKSILDDIHHYGEEHLPQIIQMISRQG